MTKPRRAPVRVQPEPPAQPHGRSDLSRRRRYRSHVGRTNNDAEQPLPGDLIEWADVVIAMDREHRNRINRRFRQQMKGKQLVVLGIPDEYDYMQPELVSLLKVRLQRWIAS